MRLLLVFLAAFPLYAQTLAIRGDRAAVPAGVTVVDGRGKYLIPGLWDMHVHLSWTTSSALPLLVANGVTSVRDLGSSLPQLDAWRTRIEDGALTGPRIVRVGPILNGQSFNKYQLVSGNPDQTRGVARALAMVGVDALKTHRRMERESYFALVYEARALGLRVVGHIPMTVTPAEASNGGQQTIEHIATLFEGTFHQLVGEAGVIMVTGSDIAVDRVPGFTLHEELELLVRIGMTPLEALRAATLNCASVAGRANDLGTIEAGKLADLVLLDADPLADIRNTRKIHAVVARGKLFRRAELDRLLAEGEALAARN